MTPESHQFRHVSPETIRLARPASDPYLPREGPEANYIAMTAALDRVESRITDAMREMKSDIREDVRILGDRVGNVESMLSDPSTGLGAINAGLAHKPSKGYIVTVAVLLLSAIAAATAFQGEIQSYLGLVPTLAQ